MRRCRIALCVLCGLWWASLLCAQAKAPVWVLPKEGAVITGKAKVQVTLPKGANPHTYSYYLEGVYELDFNTVLGKLGNRQKWVDEFGNLRTDITDRDAFAPLLELVPGARTSLDPVVIRPIRCDLSPGMEKDPEREGLYNSRDDFARPVTVDFSDLYPGKYRLVVETGKQRVVRNIELKTPAIAPVFTMEPPTIMSNGCLLVQGTISGSHAYLPQEENEDEEGGMSGRYSDLINTLARGKNIPILFDGLLVDTAGMVKDKTGHTILWATEISLRDHPFFVTAGMLTGTHRVTALYCDGLDNGVILSRTVQFPLSTVFLTARDKWGGDYFLQANNTPITLIAVAVGGTAPRYKFLLETAQGEQVLRDFSDNPTMTWTPERAGRYTIDVIACEADGSRKRKTRQELFINSVKPTISLTATPATTAPAGSRIALQAVANDHEDPKCRLEYLNGKEWENIDDDFTSGVVFDKPGTYRLRATLIGFDDMTELSQTTIAYTVTAPVPVTGVDIKPGWVSWPLGNKTVYGVGHNAPLPGRETVTKPGAPVLRTASVTAYRTGGTRKASYRWFSSADGKNWTPIITWTSDQKNGVALKALPDEDGCCTLYFPVVPEYQFLRVEVSDATMGGKPVSAEFTPATPWLFSGVTLHTKYPSPQPVGTAIDLSAEPTGNDGFFSALFSVNDGNGWQSVDMTTQQFFEYRFHEVTWVPINPGTYRLRVHAVQKGSDKAFDSEMEYVITEVP